MSKEVKCRMDYEYMAKFLCSLPSDALIEMKLAYIERPQRLMARDRPADGRRYTNLTSGTEWFIDAESLERVGVESVVIHPFTINLY